MPAAAAVGLFLTALFLPAYTLFAFQCVSRDAQAQLDDAAAVFEASVRKVVFAARKEREPAILGTECPEEALVEASIRRAWKGPGRGVARFRTCKGVGALKRGWGRKRPFLVFLRQGPRGLEVGLCDTFEASGEATGLIAELERLTRRK